MSAPTQSSAFMGESKKLRSKNQFKRKWLPSLYSPDMGLWDWQGKRKRCRLSDEEDAQGKPKSLAVVQAEVLQSKLDPKHPSFIKPLLKSHVSGGFWLGLPAAFCQKYLPQEDTFMTLESQSGKRYVAKYLVSKIGLSGGWKRYAVSEKLSVGDVLVFHLVSATKFKVFMIREKTLTEVEGALALLNMDTLSEQSGPDMHEDAVEHNNGIQQALPEVNNRTMQPPGNSENNIAEVSSRGAGSLQACEEVGLTSYGIKSFENFSILIDELLKDYELPRHVKWMYYKLCCSRNSLLHTHLLEGVNHILIAGLIIETVKIAKALRNCELSTSWDDFAIWDKTLNSLELLGMSVDFLHSRSLDLQNIVHDKAAANLRQECSQLFSENAHAVDEIRSLRATLAEMTKIHKTRAADIENLKSKIKIHELKFQEHARVSW